MFDMTHELARTIDSRFLEERFDATGDPQGCVQPAP
jgi:hypothetical protein